MGRSFFFAGGGTGGHIYPAVAVAEKIIELDSTAQVHFFCSERDIDSRILNQSGFEHTQLPAKEFSVRPGKFIEFVSSFLQSTRIAKEIIAAGDKPIVIGVGGFIAAPACWAGHKLKIPVALLNVDIVPGKANKIIARWADEIFVQFEDTAECFTKTKAKVSIAGCPLRKAFDNPEPAGVKSELELDTNKKILLITGASSGSANINDAVCSNISNLDAFADDWQIVHLAGMANYDEVAKRYSGAKISVKLLAYCDDMPSLLSAADLVIGRSGAVSIAEYAAASVPSICMPYPYHRDRHQYLNAGKLVEAGAAIIVDDVPDAQDRAEWLAEELQDLMKDGAKRREMKNACAKIARKDAALTIATKLIEVSP